MRNYKIYFSSFLKNIIIFILFFDFLYAQNEEIKSGPYISKINFAPRVGMSIDDYALDNHVKCYLVGMDINIPMNLNFLRLQYSHHFLKYDNHYTDIPKNLGKIYRNEIMISYFYKIDLERLYLGLSGGLGYWEEKNFYRFISDFRVPVTFEMGLAFNKIINCGFEIRKNAFIINKSRGIYSTVEESSYFFSFRFEIKPF